jgi:uncharacterized DUF497 family protein
LGGVTFEWDARKAGANLKKHRVGFEDAATVFLDPLAMTFPDPDHWLEESLEITVGCTTKSGMWCSFPSASAGNGFESSVRASQHVARANIMKRESTAKNGDELRQQYDLSQLRGGVRGKYYRRATAGTNLVLLDPDLAALFPEAGQ